MDFTVLTIFPEMFDAFWGHGIVRRALAAGQLTADAVNIQGEVQQIHPSFQRFGPFGIP